MTSVARIVTIQGTATHGGMQARRREFRLTVALRVARWILRMGHARSLVAVVLAILLPAAAALSTPRLAGAARRLRPCCCAAARSEPAEADHQTRLQRGSPCALARCCADDAPLAQLETVGAHPRPQLTPLLGAALLSGSLFLAAPIATNMAHRAQAPPWPRASLVIRKRSLLL